MTISKDQLFRILLGESIETDASRLEQTPPGSPEEGLPLLGSAGLFDEVDSDEEANEPDEDDRDNPEEKSNA